MWVGDPKCSEIIENTWSIDLQEGSIVDIMRCTRDCGVQLKYWNKASFGNVQKNLFGANSHIKQVLERHLTEQNVSEFPKRGKRFKYS